MCEYVQLFQVLIDLYSENCAHSIGLTLKIPCFGEALTDTHIYKDNIS